MKTVRIYLSIMALVFAIGGAIASSHLAPNTVAYEFIDNPDPMPDQCVSNTINCQTTATSQACKVTTNGPVLRETSNTSTSCGTELWRIL